MGLFSFVVSVFMDFSFSVFFSLVADNLLSSSYSLCASCRASSVVHYVVVVCLLVLLIHLSS